jgi:hypothetical protein
MPDSDDEHAKDEPLNPKHEAFAQNFVANGGKRREAAEAAGCTPGMASSVAASRMLRSEKVRERIRELEAQSASSTSEVVGTLASQMRADVADFFEEGENPIVDRARRLGVSHLIKELDITERFIPNGPGREPTREVRTKLKLYDAQAAARTLGKYKGLEVAPKENDADVTRRAEGFRALVDQLYNEALDKGEPTTRAAIAHRMIRLKPEVAKFLPDYSLLTLTSNMEM